MVNDLNQLERLEHAKHLVVTHHVLAKLRLAIPLLSKEFTDPIYSPFRKDRFSLMTLGDKDTYLLSNKHNCDEYIVYYSQLSDPSFDIVEWLTILKLFNQENLVKTKSSLAKSDMNGTYVTPEHESSDQDDSDSSAWETLELGSSDFRETNYDSSEDDLPGLESCESSEDKDTEETGELFCGMSSRTKDDLPELHSLQRQAARPKSTTHILPKSIVVVVLLNDKPCRALLDSGSLTDFMSSMIVNQLKLPYELLEKPIPLQLAVSGLRSTVKATTCAELTFQDIKCPCTFDIANLESYDVILGMPFLFQHKVLLGFNPPEIKIRSLKPLPVRGSQTQVLELHESSFQAHDIERYSAQLRKYAIDICKEAVDTPLPPLRAINHVIPLINDNHTYSWRQSKCPEALRLLWRSKHNDYIKLGHWEFFSGTNAVPMIMMRKATKDGKLRLRTILDTRQRNTDT